MTEQGPDERIRVALRQMKPGTIVTTEIIGQILRGAGYLGLQWDITRIRNIIIPGLVADKVLIRLYPEHGHNRWRVNEVTEWCR